MALSYQLIVILSALWITQCLADYYSPVDYDSYYQVPVYYHYNWEVKDIPSGNDYRQQETRDGHLTTGLYQVLLPDGNQQTVNYRVDKDSGFMADVSYQGKSNYFTFKSNYQSDPKKTSYEPAKPEYSYQPVQQPEYNYQPPEPTYYPATRPTTYDYPVRQEEPESYYYPQPEHSYYGLRPEQEYPVPSYHYDESPASYPSDYSSGRTTTAAPLTTSELAVTEDWVTESSTESLLQEDNYQSKPDYSVPMYPLYRADVYSARAKMAKSNHYQQQGGGYAIDEAGSTYIKPAAAYSVPDQLGTYEIKHRKATARKPSQSDYQAPESIIQSK